MLVPSLACPAECSYCFGPHRGPVMSAETMEATLDFLARIVAETGQRKVKVTFHGGEPLTHPQREEMLAMLTRQRQ